MRRSLVASLVALLGLITSGYALSVLTQTPPKDVLQQKLSCSPTGEKVTKQVEVLDTVQWSEGAVVLYKTFCPTKNGQNKMQQVFGYQLAKRSGMSWHVSGAGSYDSANSTSESERLVEYGLGQSERSYGDRYMVVYGQTFSPKVAAIEATFDNGKLVHAKARNGVFALVAPGADRICELRVIGNYQQILRRDDLTTLPQPEPKQQKWSNRCWQTTIQM